MHGNSNQCRRIDNADQLGYDSVLTSPPPPPPPPPPTASMSSAVHGSSATLTFSCAGVAGQSCSGTYSVTAHKTTCGSTVKAVSAAGPKKKHKPKCVPKVSTVNLGGGTYAVSAGHSTQTSFTVARNGVALLFHFYRLPTTFTFAAFSSNAPSARVVVFAYKRITSSLDNFQLAAGSSSTLVSSWPIKKIPSGGTVKVICHGGGCPFSQRVYRNKSHVSVLQGARLNVGSTVRIIVNAPFSVGEVLTATIKEPRRSKGGLVVSTPRSWRPTEVHRVTVKTHSSTTPGQRFYGAARISAQDVHALMRPLIDTRERHGP